MNPIETIYQHYQKTYNVSTDSRKIEQDAVFFALKGENFDANDFALQVAKQGTASLVVADRKNSETGGEGKQAAAAADNPTARRIISGFCAAGPG